MSGGCGDQIRHGAKIRVFRMQFASLVLRTIEEMPSWRYTEDKMGNSSKELSPLTYMLFTTDRHYDPLDIMHRLLSTFLSNLPTLVFGIASTKTTSSGSHHFAMWGRR